MELLISNQWDPKRRLPIPRKRLRQLLAALLDSESTSHDVELSVVFCDDPFIHDLNHRYRDKDKPTDVLSFTQDPESGLLGDVVISIPMASRQAETRQHPVAQELEWLFLHGCLHLLGYDDETDAGAEEMNERARAALDRLSAVVPAETG